MQTVDLKLNYFRSGLKNILIHKQPWHVLIINAQLNNLFLFIT